MQNLLRFLLKYNFQIVFLILEIFALSLVLRVNPIPRARAFKVAQEINGIVYQQFNRLGGLVGIKKENRKLIIENANLRSQIAVEPNQYPIPQDSVLLQNLQHYSVISARVVNNSVHRQNNYFTLDAGSSEGIQPDMGVIGPDGIAGIIRNVSKHFSVAISVLNSGFRISARLSSTGFFGSFEWDGRNYREALLVDIPSYAVVNVGDTVVTSGFSAIFPEGLFVGEVTEVSNTPGGSFQQIRVSLGQDFKRMSHVYIFRNTLKEELRVLEATIDE